MHYIQELERTIKRLDKLDSNFVYKVEKITGQSSWAVL